MVVQTPLLGEPLDPRDIAGVAVGHPKEEPPGIRTLARSRPECGDVSGDLPVWLLGLLCFQNGL